MPSLVRIGALSAIGSAVLAVTALVGFVLVVGSDPIAEAATTPTFYIPATAALGSVLLLGLGLVGLVLHQEGRLGPLGTAGFVVALVGTMLAAGAQWTYVFAVPYFAGPAPELVNESSGPVLAGFLVSFALMAVGWAMVGVATRRAGVLPRWAATLVVVGAVIAALPLPSRTLVLSLAVGYLGLRMLQHGRAETAEPRLA
jgi:hypothetical protein